MVYIAEEYIPIKKSPPLQKKRQYFPALIFFKKNQQFKFLKNSFHLIAKLEIKYVSLNLFSPWVGWPACYSSSSPVDTQHTDRHGPRLSLDSSLYNPKIQLCLEKIISIQHYMEGNWK